MLGRMNFASFVSEAWMSFSKAFVGPEDGFAAEDSSFWAITCTLGVGRWVNFSSTSPRASAGWVVGPERILSAVLAMLRTLPGVTALRMVRHSSGIPVVSNLSQTQSRLPSRLAMGCLATPTQPARAVGTYLRPRPTRMWMVLLVASQVARPSTVELLLSLIIRPLIWAYSR